MNGTLENNPELNTGFNAERLKKNFWGVYGIPVATIILFILFSILHENFLTFSNLMNILRATSIIAIVAIGTTIIMISGNMDISMASTMAIAGVVTIGLIVDVNLNPALAILIGLAAGCLCGLINSLIVVFIRIPSFIATLATLSVFRGICFIYTRGYSIYGEQVTDAYKFIGRGYVLGVPMPVINPVTTIPSTTVPARISSG